jgi:hypothetical protein
MLKFKILWKYLLRKGRIINYFNPKLFSEKIQWLKVYDCTPIKTKLADKLAVREWVMEQFKNTSLYCVENNDCQLLKGEVKKEIPSYMNYSNTLFLKRLYGVYDRYEDIDFSVLPEEYVIKTNHGCNMQLLVIEGGKPNSKHKDRFNEFLKVNYAYKSGFEMQYKDIVPKIFTEEFIKNTNELFEYLIFCFNGEPKMILFASGKRSDTICCTMFDTKWNNLHFNYGGCLHTEDVPSPKNLGTMLEIAKILSKDFKFVRVDLHNIDGKIFFGEMTFTPASGYMKFQPKKYDRILGKMLKLK